MVVELGDILLSFEVVPYVEVSSPNGLNKLLVLDLFTIIISILNMLLVIIYLLYQIVN